MTDASTANSRLTVALVHGAFADSSSWNDQRKRMFVKGYRPGGVLAGRAGVAGGRRVWGQAARARGQVAGAWGCLVRVSGGPGPLRST
jgi:hypothetical protein